MFLLRTTITRYYCLSNISRHRRYFNFFGNNDSKPLRTLKADLIFEAGNCKEITAGATLIHKKNCQKVEDVFSGIATSAISLKIILAENVTEEEQQQLPALIYSLKQSLPNISGYIKSLTSTIIEEEDRKILHVIAVLPLTVSMAVTSYLEPLKLQQFNFTWDIDNKSNTSPSYRISLLLEASRIAVNLLLKSPGKLMPTYLKVMTKVAEYGLNVKFDTIGEVFEIPEIPRILFGDLYEKNLQSKKVIQDLILHGDANSLTQAIIQELSSQQKLVQNYLNVVKYIHTFKNLTAKFKEDAFELTFNFPNLVLILPKEEDFQIK